MIMSDFLSRILKKQPAPSDFLPKICQHVTPNLIWYKDGYVGFVIRMEGLAFDGVDDKHLYTSFSTLRNLFAALGKTLGNRLSLWTTLQRKKINFDRKYHFSTNFCKQFAGKYLKRFQDDDYFENLFYITTLVKCSDIDEGIKEAEELINIMMRSLDVYV